MRLKQLLGLLMIFVSTISFSQWVYTSSYSVDAGNPGGINSESDAPGQGTWTTIMSGGQATNVWSPVTAIPIPFTFYGNPVTQFKASQNGLVTFDVGTTLLPNANESLPSVNLPDSTVCVFWDEFTVAAPTGTNDEIRVNTFGTAPNRQFWITWYSFEMGNPLVSFSYFSLVLEETTNNIYVVDKYATGSSSTFTSTVGVQLNSTTGFDAGNSLALSGNGSFNLDNDYYSFFPELLVSDNAGVSAMNNPIVPLTAGLQNIDVTVQNYGINDLNSFTVNWEINSVSQTPFLYTTPILPVGIASAPLTLGTYNFPTGFTDLKFWTSLPNGNADGNPLDDTLFISACTSLSGIYSIGGASPDFATITEATDALTNCGVSGPVTFNIAPGVYNEFAALPVINGSSATNTITFDGGSAATTSIVHDGVGQNAILGFTGADYVTWKNLTLENTATNSGWGIHMSDTSDYNMIDSCIIIMDSAATIDAIGIVIGGSTTNNFTEGNGGNYNMFSNNTITGGEMGVHMEGPFAIGEWMLGNTFINNDISGMDDYGFYIDQADSITIIGNRVYGNRATAGDGIFCLDIANFNISENVVNVPDWGLYVADGNFDFPVTGQSQVVNNMVTSISDYGIYFDDINNIDIFHNTSVGRPGMRINDFTGLDIRNNIFSSDSDFAFESDDLIGTNAVVDYNMYWTPASNTNFVDIQINQYADLAAWQAAIPANNAGSIEMEPDFVAVDDLHRVGANGNDLGDNTVGILVDIDGEARPIVPSITVDMGADEYFPLANDAVMESIIPESWLCGDSNSLVYAVVSNLGTSTIASLPITVEVTGDITATLNTTYTNPIVYGQTDTILVGTINSYAGGSITMTGWTALPLEQDTSNDTVMVTTNYIPFEPVGINGFGCGVDSALIFASSGYPVTYEWYDSLVGGSVVGAGSSYMIPSIAAQDTYYLQYSGSIDSLETTYAGGNGCGAGNMMDVSSSAGSAITGLRVNNDDGAGIPVSVNVYYITGSSYLGNETNPSAWTSAGNYTVISGGAGNPSSELTLTAPIALPSGVTVALYVEYDADYTNGTSTFTNGNISISTGAGLCTSFGSVISGRIFNGTLFFGGSACSSVRTPVSAQQVAAITTDLGVDSTICGPSITLDAGNPTATTFEWSDSVMTQTNTIDTTGVYWVVVTDSNGCTATDTVDLIISPLNVTLPASALTICTGDSATLMPTVVADYPYTFAWSNASPTLDVTVNTTGNYTITVSDTLGCSDMASTDLTVQDAPVAGFTDVLGGFGVDLDVTSTATNSDSTVYDFGDGSAVVNADDATHTYTTNGTYTVCQYVYNGCSADTLCITVDINSVGIEELNANAIQLFPNPANEMVHVSFSGMSADELQVVTSDGKVVSTYEIEDNMITVNVESLPNGIYFVRVTGTHGVGVKRFIKE